MSAEERIKIRDQINFSVNEYLEDLKLQISNIQDLKTLLSNFDSLIFDKDFFLILIVLSATN